MRKAIWRPELRKRLFIERSCNSYTDDDDDDDEGLLLERVCGAFFRNTVDLCWNWVLSDDIQTQNLRTPSYTVITVDESESSLTIPYSGMYCYSGVWVYGDDERKSFRSTYLIVEMRKYIHVVVA